MKIIQASEVASLPRGRKATYEAVLVKACEAVKPGTFGIFEQSEFPKATGVTLPIPPSDKAKDQRAKVSGLIRKHWAKVHGADSTVSILWTPDGFPQVGTKPKA